MKQTRSFLSGSAIIVMVFTVALQALLTHSVNAAQITNRSLTLQGNGTNTNGSAPGIAVNHAFAMSLPTSGSLGSIRFEYCTTAANSPASPTCVMPIGLLTTTATVGTQSGATGFTMVNTTNGVPYLTRTAATGSGAVTFRLDNVTNPGPQKGTFFVRISTYTSTNTSGSPVDMGTVTASTVEPIVLTGTMPESLVFCTGGNISLTTGVPDCSTATSGLISFDQLFSSTSTAAARSQMAASTNAGFGYAITVNGPTMTSGTNTITANSTASASVKGTSQFGVNLRANTVAAATGFDTANSGTIFSGDLTATSNGTNFNGRALANYGTPDTFTFIPGAIVADSNFDGTGDPNASDSQIYTASYVVNVPGSQPAGTYTTTLTYICTPTF